MILSLVWLSDSFVSLGIGWGWSKMASLAQLAGGADGWLEAHLGPRLMVFLHVSCNMWPITLLHSNYTASILLVKFKSQFRCKWNDMNTTSSRGNGKVILQDRI